MMQAIDYGTLEKGDVISAEHIEQITETNRNDPAYQLKMMGVCEQVRRDLARQGKHYTVVTQKQQVVVLNDAEASEYNDAAFSSHIRRMKHRHHLMSAVDAGELDIAHRKHHERRLVVQSSILQAIAAKRSELRLAPTTRQTPTLG